MSSAYNTQWVYNLAVIKETKSWAKHHFITTEQFAKISEEYKTPFYHPNLIIRILLFVATLFALSGISGILGLMFAQTGETFIYFGCIVYGIGSFVALEKMFIAKNHFKSGVTEAVMYHACGFVILGVCGLTDFNSPQLIMFTCLIIFSFAAFRYLDLITTVAAIGSLAAIIFYNCFEAGGIFKQVIPFVFIFSFSAIFFLVRKLKSNSNLKMWGDNLLVLEIICLLLIYVSGNYLVVRELSVNLMNLNMAEGEDIPFAFLFYFLTVVVPIGYLYFGIKNRDMALLRVSLILVAFTVFTFKYYYSLGHTEITLMFAGAILIAVAILVMRYLKVMRNGFTRENLLSSKWANMNLEAFVISQTMGGNQTDAVKTTTGGGGSFGGGGSSDSF
ncbi:MAG TPA: hypothetical protein VGQ59_19175 [Cyclobacteriaceae bacterium]|jgi:hypothetical protein|nr:hypothetical protein [Cyclobacteriaceae bacterium]